MHELPKLDPMFHQQVRTRIALLLYLEEPSFSKLKSVLSITDGNLDAHLRKLSAAGYLHSRMVLEGRPHTVYQLSPSGMYAFEKYLSALRAVVCVSDEKPSKAKSRSHSSNNKSS